MSSDVKGFVVALEHDLSDDVAEDVARAIRLLKGVLSVTPSKTTPEPREPAPHPA